MRAQRFDVVVIGGGVIGCSAAFQLARRGARVAILEKGNHVGVGSTGQSSAIIRQRYTNIQLVRLAHYGLRMFQNWTDRLDLVEDRCGFCPVGVLWLTGQEGPESHKTFADDFARAGVKGGVCSVDEVRDRYPSLNFCIHPLDMAGEPHQCADPEVVFWEREGGFADPQGTTEDFLLAGQNRGAELFVEHHVTAVEHSGFTFRLRCANGTRFECGQLINAAGPWCNRVNALLGVELPHLIRPIRVQVALRDRPAELTGEIPVFAAFPDEIYVRRELHGQQLLVGSISHDDERDFIDDPDRYDTTASREFRDRMMHKLHHRFDMKSRGQVQGYAGLYSVNTVDWHPIIDAIGPQGYFVANGFSGHGFKLAPAVGAMLASMMTGVAMADDPQVDFGLFSADRKTLNSSGGVLA